MFKIYFVYIYLFFSFLLTWKYYLKRPNKTNEKLRNFFLHLFLLTWKHHQNRRNKANENKGKKRKKNLFFYCLIHFRRRINAVLNINIGCHSLEIFLIVRIEQNKYTRHPVPTLSPPPTPTPLNSCERKKTQSAVDL